MILNPKGAIIIILPVQIRDRLLKILSIKNFKNSDISLKKIFLGIIFNSNIEKQNFILSNYGVWMKSNFYDRTFRFSLMGYRNGLEKILLKINTPMIFIDIGANQGVFSLIASKNKNISEIHAFEPNYNCITYLQDNLIFNKVNNYVIHNTGIGFKESIVDFHVEYNHSGSGRVSNQDSNMKVSLVNRNYLNKYFLKTDVEYFIKIDTEGSEKEILVELFKSKIKFCIKYIFIEINSKYNDENSLLGILTENGFCEKSRKGNSTSFDALFMRI